MSTPRRDRVVPGRVSSPRAGELPLKDPERGRGHSRSRGREQPVKIMNQRVKVPLMIRPESTRVRGHLGEEWALGRGLRDCRDLRVPYLLQDAVDGAFLVGKLCLD